LSEIPNTGGTDGLGNFCIPLDRPLVNGDAIFAVDVCPPFSPADPLVGGVVLVFAPAPTPALGRTALLLLLGVLAGVAFVGLRRTSVDARSI
jgi:hypothetical protein